MMKLLTPVFLIASFVALQVQAQDAPTLVPHAFPMGARVAFSLTSLTEDTAITPGSSTKPPISEPPSQPLTHRQKFRYFTSNTFEPFTFLGAGLEAGISQLDHDNLGFGQGADGFASRYGAAVGDR